MRYDLRLIDAEKATVRGLSFPELERMVRRGQGSTPARGLDSKTLRDIGIDRRRC